VKKLVLLVGLALLILPAAAHAAPPAPFGHACTPQNGVLFCPTASDAERVPSFDGVPLDVDVTLPATGDGPFPTLVMMHGYGGDKTNFEATDPAAGQGYNNVAYAQRGYAVVTYSARGFGRSCGLADSRTPGACDRGWIHLSDQRFEARDTQHLLGLLVDQGVTVPDRIGVTGISYGGIQSQILARLKDRVRMPDGSFRPWTSPAGRPLRIAAAYARWGSSDLTYALTPNGRFLDFRGYRVGQSQHPAGILKKSYVSGLFVLGTLRGFVAPAGADPGADLAGWLQVTDAGEPYGRAAARVASELTRFHSAAGIGGTPAPMIVQNGWTDDLFPAPEALRNYVTYRNTRGARVSYQFGDLGHSRGSNKANADQAFNAQAARLFDVELGGQPGTPPANNAVTAFTQTCPKDRPAGGPYSAASWEKLHPGAIRFGGGRPQTVRSDGGSLTVAKAFDQVAGGDACLTVKRERSPGTAVYEQRVRRPITLLGLPTIKARLRTVGKGGTLIGQLWDVADGRQRLISRGVYRLRDDQTGTAVFQLWGNGYRFERGHTIKLELVGRSPSFMRVSNDRFRVRIARLRVELPLHERPSRTRGVARPLLGR
jgi:pimeloyl-ACP methyl ester carboxylesterase